MRSLKFLPWRSLLQVSAFSTLLVVLLEFVVGSAYKQSDLIRRILSTLYTPPLDSLMSIAIAVGVGALAVYLLERLHQQVFINKSSLWALVLCLALLFILKLLLPLPPGLVNFNQIQLLGLAIGVFWKGRPYWR